MMNIKAQKDDSKESFFLRGIIIVNKVYNISIASVNARKEKHMLKN